MASVFSRIVSGELPAFRLAETEGYLAFLDINPMTEGHTLVIPKVEVDNIFDLEQDDYVGLFIFVKEISKAIAKSVVCARIGMAVVGFDVPHAHVHLVPMNHISDMDFGRDKLKMDEKALESLAKIIRNKIG